MNRAAVAALLLAPALLLTACSASASVGSDPTVPKAQVEEKISTALAESVGTAPDSVTCPGDLPATVGASITCSLTAGGDTLGVTATATSVNGSDVKIGVKVDDAVSPSPS